MFIRAGLGLILSILNRILTPISHLISTRDLRIWDGLVLYALNTLHNANPMEIQQVHEMLVDKMHNSKPVSATTIKSFKAKVSTAYKNATTTKSPSKHFINKMAKAYNNINDFKADAVTPYVRQNRSIEGIHNAFRVMKAIDDIIAGGDAENGIAMAIGESSPLNDIVRQSLKHVTSVNAKSNIPNIKCNNIACSYRNILKKGMKGGSIYGGDDVPAPAPAPPVKKPEEPPVPVEEPKVDTTEEKIKELKRLQDMSGDDDSDSDSDEADALLAQFADFPSD